MQRPSTITSKKQSQINILGDFDVRGQQKMDFVTSGRVVRGCGLWTIVL